MSRTAHLLSLPRLWTLAFMSLLVLAVLYRLSAVDDDGMHRVELAADELAAVDVTANLEMMKLRHRERLDYDGLVAVCRRAGELLDQLQPEFERLALATELSPAREAWQEKHRGIERFKQLNSILSTSQFHFVNLAEYLGRRQDSPLLDQVSRRLLAYVMQGSAGDPEVLMAGLKDLEKEIDRWPEATRTEGKLLVIHGNLILDHSQKAQQVSRALLASPFAAKVGAAFRAYNKAQRRDAAVANQYRQVMAAFALILVATVVVALFRLRKSAGALERSHRLLDSIADNLGEGIAAFDREGRAKFVNRQAEILLGRREKDLLGRPARDILAGEPDGASPFLAALEAREHFYGEDWLASGQGPLPVAYMGSPLPAFEDEPDSGGYVVSFRDLSEQRKAQARLHLAALVFDSLAEAMVITNSQGRIQSVNPAFTRITGYTEEEARGRKPGEVLASGQYDPAFFAEMWDVLNQHGQWQGEIVNRRKSGELYTEWLSISALRDPEGRVIQYIGLFSDISDRKQAEAHIHHLAYHDPLTGLPNRRLFRDRLDTALRQAHRSDRQLAVLMLDLDRFKTVNDTLGHEGGDRLLKEVAHRLGSSIRECDTLSRLGGDEFALLMPEIRDAADAAALAHKLHHVLSPAIDLGGREVFVTTSVGIAIYPDHGESGEELLRSADMALYAAKGDGRNTWHVFDPACQAAASDRLDLETSLRHAVNRRELVLHYQVQVDASLNHISGAEALIRWQHPDRGLLSPDAFIAVAEQTGLIEGIGAWCLEAACEQLARWQAQGIAIPRVAVNVSARQLRTAGFAERVMAVLARTGIRPDQLELELTESMLSDDPGRIFNIFSELRRHGVRIAIDDFGTGYSSLNYLAQFPVDVIKIDRSFVRSLDGQADSSSLVRAIILMAQSMNMETVAEGVEAEGQKRELANLGCNHLQGFLFAPPRPPEALPAVVRKLSNPALVLH